MPEAPVAPAVLVAPVVRVVLAPLELSLQPLQERLEADPTHQCQQRWGSSLPRSAVRPPTWAVTWAD